MGRDVFLPQALADRIAGYPELQMGVHCVTVRLHDGRTYFPVLVAWATEVVRVEGSETVPFRSEDIADIRPENREGRSGPRSRRTVRE